MLRGAAAAAARTGCCVRRCWMVPPQCTALFGCCRRRRSARAPRRPRKSGVAPPWQLACRAGSVLPTRSVGDRRVGTAARCRREHATWLASQARQGAAAALVHRGFCAQHHRAAASAPRPSRPPPPIRPLLARTRAHAAHRPRSACNPHRSPPPAAREAVVGAPRRAAAPRGVFAALQHAARGRHCTAQRWMDAVRCASARTTSSAPTPSPIPRCRRPDRRSSNGSAMHRCVRRSSRTMSGRSSRTSCARACATTSQSRYG